MSLNKFTQRDKGYNIDLKIGCKELKVNDVVFEGNDGSSGDVLTTDGAGTLTLQAVPPPTTVSTFGFIENDNTSTGPLAIPAGLGVYLQVCDTSVANIVNLPPAYYDLVPNGVRVLQSGRYRVVLQFNISIAQTPNNKFTFQFLLNNDTTLYQGHAKVQTFDEGSNPLTASQYICLTDVFDLNVNDFVGFGINALTGVNCNPNAYILTIERVGDL